MKTAGHQYAIPKVCTILYVMAVTPKVVLNPWSVCKDEINVHFKNILVPLDWPTCCHFLFQMEKKATGSSQLADKDKGNLVLAIQEVEISQTVNGCLL